MSACFFAFAPGLPHLLQEKGPSWKQIAEGYKKLGQNLATAQPDVLCVFSTQWMSVLGTSFQCHPHPQGVHVDENWHEYPDLVFDFKTDPTLGEALAASVQAKGFPTKTVAFDSFPIDTGTLVSLRFLNPHSQIPVAAVSSWVYADSQKARAIGQAIREACDESQKRVAFIACSLMSSHYSPFEVNPERDKMSDNDNSWNQKMLSLWEQGNLDEAVELCPRMAQQTGADMGLNAFHWLRGTMGDLAPKATIHAYGPVWGTGAAVVEFRI